MTQLGYNLTSEEHGPNELVEYAARAEEVGFDFAAISDHYHPWIETQGNAPFVWATLGGIARATENLQLGTGVTCPTMRIHPAIIAQAAATAATMLPGRFFLGVGTGERLNEHVLGGHWPPHHVRLDMLEEAVGLIRELWTGEMHSHDGRFYTVEDARIFTLPDELPPIHVSGLGPETAEAAGRLGDGLIATSPKRKLVDRFERGGGKGPRYGMLTVCYAEDEREARKTALEHWPNGALKGVGTELPTPHHFEQASKMVTEDAVAKSIVTGPDPEKHVEHVQKFVDAGFDRVWIHQVGPNQEEFFRFYEEAVVPEFT